VKALLGPRGKKQRSLEHRFIADGLQSLRSALIPPNPHAPIIDILYLTDTGLAKLSSEFSEEQLGHHEIIMVSDSVMDAMSETQSPQGMMALCKFQPWELSKLVGTKPRRVAYFWQIQDPGNAGTAIRTADACGFDLVVLSDLSVDLYSPKVVRSCAGSLWNIPVIEDVNLKQFIQFATNENLNLAALDGAGARTIHQLDAIAPTALIFGNEARGLPDLSAEFSQVEKVRIPMQGRAESFNVASAAAIAMYYLANSQNPESAL
jgi:TrmH family RNA methyltransferase